MVNSKNNLSLIIVAYLLTIVFYTQKVEASSNSLPTLEISTNFTLKHNLNACIVIKKSDIVVDLAGYNLIGNGHGTGILVDGYNNIEICGYQEANGYGSVHHFKKGIVIINSENCKIQKCDINNCTQGLDLNSNIKIQVYDIWAEYCDTAVYVSNNQNSDLWNITCKNNYKGIVGLKNKSCNRTSLNCLENLGNGIEMHFEEYCVYNGIWATDNSNKGMEFRNCISPQLSYCFFERNISEGLCLSNFSESGTYNSCDFDKNFDGLYISQFSNKNEFDNCRGNDNTDNDLDDNNGQGIGPNYNDYNWNSCDFDNIEW